MQLIISETQIKKVSGGQTNLTFWLINGLCFLAWKDTETTERKWTFN